MAPRKSARSSELKRTCHSTCRSEVTTDRLAVALQPHLAAPQRNGPTASSGVRPAASGKIVSASSRLIASSPETSGTCSRSFAANRGNHLSYKNRLHSLLTRIDVLEPTPSCHHENLQHALPVFSVQAIAASSSLRSGRRSTARIRLVPAQCLAESRSALRALKHVSVRL